MFQLYNSRPQILSFTRAGRHTHNQHTRGLLVRPTQSTTRIKRLSVLPKHYSRHDRRAWFTMTTSKHLDSPHSHIKGNSVLKACWANILYVC